MRLSSDDRRVLHHCVDADDVFMHAAHTNRIELLKYVNTATGICHNIRVQGLCAAARHGYLEIVQYLFSQVTWDVAIGPALNASADNGHLNVVKYIVSLVGDVTRLDTNAIYGSAQAGHFEIVKYLIEHGMRDDIVLNRCLWCASTSGHLDIVEYLVDNGAGITELVHTGLRTTIANNHLHIIQYLISRGANVNADDGYMLAMAVRSQRYDIVRCLIENGANVRSADDDALRLCATFNIGKIIEYLMYEVCYGTTNEFESKLNIIRPLCLDADCLAIFEAEAERRRSIFKLLKTQLPSNALEFQLRPTSLRLRFMAKYFGQDTHMRDRAYWE